MITVSREIFSRGSNKKCFPYLIREYLFGLGRRLVRREAKLNFPGLQTPPCATAPLMQRVADALGRELRWNSPDHGAFRLSAADDEARADVHVDNPRIDNVFGGVLYLSLPEHSRGGPSSNCPCASTASSSFAAISITRRPSCSERLSMMAGWCSSSISRRSRTESHGLFDARLVQKDGAEWTAAIIRPAASAQWPVQRAVRKE